MKLFEPITIRGIEFKNRIVMPPMQVGVGMRSSRAWAYYMERARGGAGTIIVAATSVDLFATDDAWGRQGGVDAFVEGLHPLTDGVRENGARIGVQLWHGNLFPAGTGTPRETRGEAVAPSATAETRALTAAEIDTIVSRFAHAAANVRRAGFDFVEVHGAHGYLFCQFFSPATNHRDDEYGGDFAGRTRFGTRCVSAMRTAAGDDFPIFYRLGAWENIPDGITLEDSARFAAELEKAGVDVLDVSVGTVLEHAGSFGPERSEGTLVPLAEAVKRAVQVPVIAVGRFRTPEVAERVVAEGRADMVAIGRQLIADPYWPEKVAAGRSEDITPCISCNSCFETGFGGLGLACSVNAAAGRERELTVEPAAAAKKVMVVGGGPAGMEAARVAALRGHRVAIYEQQPQLGGQLVPAAVPPFKHELESLRHYMARQLEKGGVEVKLGVEVTPQLVESEKPDALILATGSTHLTPQIRGIGSKKVVSAIDVLSGHVEVGEQVVIVGGELVACETADFLSQRGHKVTVVRRGAEMASRMFPSNRHALLSRLEDKGVVLVPAIREYEEVTDEGLVVVDGQGTRRTLQAGTIVLAAGAVPDDQLAKAVASTVREVHVAGDCAGPRRILNAIHEGARVGRAL